MSGKGRPGGPRGTNGVESGVKTSVVYGMHSVLELLERRPRDVNRVYVATGRSAGLGPLLRLARDAGIPVSHLPRELLAKKIGARAVHQGVAAQVSATPYADATALCQASARAPSALLVLLDGIVDPRNLGAIVRTCAAAGADAVLLGRGSVGLTPAVAKVSAGTVERVPVARESSPERRLRDLVERGFKAVVLDPKAKTTWDALDLTGRIVLVAGSEERGVRPAVARACPIRVAIPLAGGVESLNVAVALGVLLFEAVRQRRSKVGNPLPADLAGRLPVPPGTGKR